MNSDDLISSIYQRYSVMPGSRVSIQAIKAWWPSNKIHMLADYLHKIENEGLIEIEYDRSNMIKGIRRLQDQFKIETWDRKKSTHDSYQTIILNTKSGKVVIDVFYLKALESEGKEPYVIQILYKNEESYFRFKKEFQSAVEAFENFISKNKEKLTEMELLANGIETEENRFISSQVIEGICSKYNILTS